MLQIAIIGSKGFPYVYGGYETFISELAPCLIDKGYKVTVYCHRKLFNYRPSMVKGVHLVYIPGIESKILSQLTHSLLSTLHVIFTSNDIIFYVNPANGPFGIMTKLFKKYTAINTDGLEWLRPKWKGLGAKYFYVASKMAAKYFDVIVADSERIAEIYEKEFGAKSEVIAYGANLQKSQTPELLQKYNLKPGDYYIIIGRLIPDNNAALIVKGFENSKTTRKLVIVGDVPYRDQYAESIKQTKDPRILFTGYVRDTDMLRELYCNSFAYIHGHEYGGTNPTLLTALASSCCVLALDTAFNREVLDNQEYGIYFKKEIQEITQLIDNIDSDEVRVNSFRSKAQKRIVNKYTWELITDQYENLFKHLINKSLI